MKTYEATIYYLSKDKAGENSTTIIFNSLSDKQSVLDVMAWFADRKASVPEVFSILVAVRVNYFVVKSMLASGYLPMNRESEIWHWKYDWPGTWDCYLGKLNEDQLAKEIRITSAYKSPKGTFPAIQMGGVIALTQEPFPKEPVMVRVKITIEEIKEETNVPRR